MQQINGIVVTANLNGFHLQSKQMKSVFSLLKIIVEKYLEISLIQEINEVDGINLTPTGNYIHAIPLVERINFVGFLAAPYVSHQLRTRPYSINNPGDYFKILIQICLKGNYFLI
jgi:hypothetical protein